MVLGGGYLFACSDTTSTGSSSGTSGTSGTSGSTDDAGTLGLYERLGGKVGLEAFVTDTVEKHILADAELAT